MIKVETDRLYLREFRESDAAALLTYLYNPRVNCFMSEQLLTLEAAEHYITEKQKDNLNLVMSLKDTDELIGNLFAEKESPDTFSVGWHINAMFEGKGYAFEAVRAYLSYLFERENARRIYAFVEEDNLRSRRLCERLGMRCEGCLREFISFVNNVDGTPKYENTCIYAILKKEWDV